MFSWDDPDDRIAIVQMDAELHHAELELISAQRATHQLRLRFSIQDLARFGERTILRKAIAAATDLNDYYSSIEKLISRAAENSNAGGTILLEEQIAQATERALAYLREQRDRHYAAGEPLSAELKARMQPFFSPGILDRRQGGGIGWGTTPESRVLFRCEGPRHREFAADYAHGLANFYRRGGVQRENRRAGACFTGWCMLSSFRFLGPSATLAPS